jgi:hypothetical protein
MPHYLCLRQCPRLNHRLLHINFLEFGKLGIWKALAALHCPEYCMITLVPLLRMYEFGRIV